MSDDRPGAGGPQTVSQARSPYWLALGSGAEGRRAARWAALASGVVAIAVFAWWAADGGGYPPATLAPGAAAFIVVLAVVVLTGHARLDGPARVPVVAFAAFTAWSFASIAWADARGDAWDGANRTLLYLAVFALFATVPRRPRDTALVLGGFAVATVTVCAASVGAALAGDAADLFPGGRFYGPIGYPNAVAALLLMAFWPSVLLACRREAPPVLRGVLLAAAGVALELIVLTQSRGAVVSGAVTVVLALALAPERLRLVGALAAVALPALGALPVLLDVFEAARDGTDGPLTRAAVAIGVSAVVLAAGGWAWGLREAARAARPRRARALTPRWRWGLAVVAVVVVAGVGIALREQSDVAMVTGPAAGSRFTGGVESGRYNMWRVALHEFAREPLLGVGVDNFAHDYVRERRTHEEPLYPHSIELRVLAQTGLPGTLLFGAFLFGVLAAVRPRARDAQAALSGAALVAAAAWLVQGTLDWLWEIPAVAAPALACLGLVVASAAARPAPALAVTARGDHIPARRMAVPSMVITAALVVFAVLSLALPALAAREIDAAIRAPGADPATARVRLDRARDLNPLSARADVVAGALARQAGDDRRAAAAFARAVDRDERNWYPHVQRGLLDAEAGRWTAARAHVARARVLNPRSQSVRAAAATVARGRVASAALRRRLARQAVTGPLRRRPAACVPTFSISADCLPGR